MMTSHASQEYEPGCNSRSCAVGWPFVLQWNMSRVLIYAKIISLVTDVFLITSKQRVMPLGVWLHVNSDRAQHTQ